MESTNHIQTGNCPYRNIDGGGITPGPDVWRRHEQDLDQQSCSYCGSLHPDAFMAGLESGDILLGATDKTYKVYVQRKDGQELGSMKFYFYHLTPAQQTRFIELNNDQRLRFSSGIGFYVLPYFCRVKGPGDV